MIVTRRSAVNKKQIFEPFGVWCIGPHLNCSTNPSPLSLLIPADKVDGNIKKLIDGTRCRGLEESKRKRKFLQ